MNNLFLKVACVAFSFFSLVEQASLAATLLDQAFDNGSGLGSGVAGGAQFAQTFTVGLTGHLASVDVMIALTTIDQNSDFVFDVRPTSGGIPQGDSSALASITVSGSTVPTSNSFVTMDLSSFDIPVHAGDLLAIVITPKTLQGSIQWEGWFSSSLYSGGMALSRDVFGIDPNPAWGATTPTDFYFQTFVSVPEPSSLMLAAFGLVGLLACDWASRYRSTARRAHSYGKFRLDGRQEKVSVFA